MAIAKCTTIAKCMVSMVVITYLSRGPYLLLNRYRVSQFNDIVNDDAGQCLGARDIGKYL